MAPRHLAPIVVGSKKSLVRLPNLRVSRNGFSIRKSKNPSPSGGPGDPPGALKGPRSLIFLDFTLNLLGGPGKQTF